MKPRQLQRTRWTAIGLLSQYLAGRRDFRHADLRGVALADVDLSGIDLRGADLRGANLQGSRLCGANLTDARLGVTQKRRVLHGFYWLLVGLLTLLSIIQLLSLCLSQIDGEFPIRLTLVLSLADKLRLPTIFAVVAFIAGAVAFFGRETIAGIVRTMCMSICVSVIMVVTGFVFIVAGSVLMMFLFSVAIAGNGATGERIFEVIDKIWPVVPVGMIFVIGFICLRLRRKALQRDIRLRMLRDWILWFTCLKGTDLRGADLTDADLRRARVDGSDFRNAQIQRARFTDTKGIESVQASGTDLDTRL